MADTLKGRVTLSDSSRKFSRLGVFDSVGNGRYICLEKVVNPQGTWNTYLTRNESNERFANRAVSPGDIVNLTGEYKMVGEERCFIGETATIMSRCKDKKRSDIFDTAQNAREVITLRSNFQKSIRSYFESNGFTEIISPVLLPVYEGGDADPFRTTDKEGNELFLKETSELILRRLISCGVGPVYEIGRSFRNIGANKNSLQEFSVVESAVPYANLSEGMNLAEDLLKTTLRRLNSTNVPLNSEWDRLNFEEIYKNLTGISYTPKLDYSLDRKDLSKVMGSIKGNPTFLVGLPHETSPINARNYHTLNEAVLVINGDVYCDICEFEVHAEELEKRLANQEKRTGRKNSSFLKFAEQGLVPGVGVAFGLERWMKYISGRDITELKNLGGIL